MLTNEVLRIDSGRTVAYISNFIQKKYAEFGRGGIVVPISGGLDSSVVAALCVEAVGKDKVIGLMLPERQGNPDAKKFAKKIAEFLGIKTKHIPITKALIAIGTYSFVLSFFPTKRLRDRIASKYMGSAEGSLLLDSIRGSDSRLRRAARASINSKQRIRLVVLNKFAEENNYLVVGSAHLTEDLVGLFVKFGIDDDADLMPIKGLFRTQILQLARHLGLPVAITGRAPNPDVIPGVDDKYLDMLGISADRLDLILYGLIHDLPTEEISGQLGVDKSKVEEVRELIHLSEHMRHHAQAPSLDNECDSGS